MMEREKDIKKEVERYVKYNYSKRDSIAHLRRDGFDEAEIQENIKEYFTPSDSNFNSNPLCFGFTLVHLFVIAFLALSQLFLGENVGLKVLSLIVAIIVSAVVLGYYKSDKNSILTALILILLFAAGCFYTYIKVIFETKMSLPGILKRLPLILYIWVLYYVVDGNYVFYKKVQED